MRLSSLDEQEWTRWAPYVDTILLPLYQVRISGKQPELGEARRIREVADRVEKELTGRLLLLPGIPYGTEDPDLLRRYVESVAQELSVNSGFHHLIFLAPEAYREWLNPGAKDPWDLLTLPGGTDLDQDELAEEISEEIVAHWEANLQE